MSGVKCPLPGYGGTGQGVVGALAGVGLRLYGDDGRFRGWYHSASTNAGALKVYDFSMLLKAK